MNLPELETRDLIEFGITLVLVAWIIILYINAYFRNKENKSLKLEIANNEEQISNIRTQSDTWFKKYNNRVEQCNRLEGERLVLKEKNVKLTEELREARFKLIAALGDKTEESPKMKVVEQEHKTNSRTGKRTPSSKKGSISGNKSERHSANE